MSYFCIIRFCTYKNCAPQCELSIVADEAARKYKETTENPTAEGIWEAMSRARTLGIKSLRQKQFEKMLAIADEERNGAAFFEEVHPLTSTSTPFLHSSMLSLLLYYYDLWSSPRSLVVRPHDVHIV